MKVVMNNKKIIISSLVIIALLVGLASCTDNSNNYVEWANVVESKTVLLQPEGWDDEYWNSVNQGVDRDKIFSTIVGAVFEGKLEAYDILTDEPLTIDEAKARIVNLQMIETGEMVSSQITKDDLSMIRMRESWSFDDENFTLRKKVTRLDLLLKKLDFEGVYIGNLALFYVYLNN